MSQLSHLRLAGLLKKTAQVARSEEELVWTNSLALSGLAAHLEPAKAMVGKIARSDWGLYLSIQCPDNAWLLSRRINNRVSCKRCLVLCYRLVFQYVRCCR